MIALKPTFVNGLSQIKQMRLIPTHLKLWVGVARHKFEWLEILIR